MEYFIIGFLLFNIFAYSLMIIDKVKSIYGFWRISERFLLIIGFFGGAFGIFLGMHAPLYHKAWKYIFRLWIPVFMWIWTFVWIIFYYFFAK